MCRGAARSAVGSGWLVPRLVEPLISISGVLRGILPARERAGRVTPSCRLTASCPEQLPARGSPGGPGLRRSAARGASAPPLPARDVRVPLNRRRAQRPLLVGAAAAGSSLAGSLAEGGSARLGPAAGGGGGGGGGAGEAPRRQLACCTGPGWRGRCFPRSGRQGRRASRGASLWSPAAASAAFFLPRNPRSRARFLPRKPRQRARGVPLPPSR